ncbi:MAG: PRC-barrel domain-containing protein [Hyphomicrobium sp.]|nr:PRC-barrel domain-containing protein [Hyphomicrobium sp.]
MKKLIVSFAASLMAATAAIAQTAPEPTTPPAPAEKIEEPAAPAATPAPAAAPSTTAATPAAGVVTLTDEQAKAWVDKPIYSSDNKNLGEVAAIARGSSGEISEIHADIGGFLGLGETRVRVMPNEFSLGEDKVVLNLTADQAKQLPTIAK